jgi:hypothetical protein
MKTKNFWITIIICILQIVASVPYISKIWAQEPTATVSAVPATPTTVPTQTPTPSYTPTPTSICNVAAPGSAPKLISAVPTSKNQITLTWTKASDPVTYYLLSYGVKSGTYIYGNPYIGDATKTSYVVGNLAAGTTYYFQIRAGNGCMPGAFSNELSAVMVLETPTPTIFIDTSVQEEETPTATPIMNIEESTEDTVSPTAIPLPTVSGTTSTVRTIVFAGMIIGIICIIAGIIISLRMQHASSFDKEK